MKRSVRLNEDHPRSRGVYNRMMRPLSASRGSSPLARGLRRRRGGPRRRIRIIPARAGFTSTTVRLPARDQDHPRSRGVYDPCIRGTVRTEGSSPLARGLRRSCGRPRAGSGIIPARAGFTCAVGHGLPQRGDHPRSRGVYVTGGDGFEWGVEDHPRSRGVYPSLLSQYCFARGSSPLARGLR